ncbi:MAG: hypothetical protein KC468_35040, partial [Myxococcales bacterium]|nr:hypothetical protein [Myxococcales bacterium]
MPKSRPGEHRDRGPEPPRTLAALAARTITGLDPELAMVLRRMPIRALVRVLRSAPASRRLIEVTDALGATTLGELVGFADAAEAETHANAAELDAALETMLEPGERMWLVATLAQAIEANAAQLAQATTAWAPRGLSEGPAIDEPPTKAPALLSWARVHEVEARARGELSTLGAWLPPELQGALEQLPARDRPETVLDCFPSRRRRASRGSRAEVLERVAQIARMYLYYHAYERAVTRQRDALWEQPPREAELARLSGRLREALAELRRSPHAEEPAPFDHNPVVIDIAVGAAVFHHERGRGRAKVLLAGFEDNALRVECDCEHGRAGCKHARLLLGWLLDAIHDERHPLHAALVELARLPTWARLLSALEDVAARRAASALRGERAREQR